MLEALRRWPALALAAVTVAVLIAYYRQVFEGLMPAGYDMQTYFFPMRGYAREALLDGRVPLWTPNVFTGAPFVANPQTAVFYVFNLLLLPLAPAVGLATTVVLHVWIGAVGMALFTRRVLGLRPAATVVAALAFGLGGVVSAQSGHPNQIATIAWIPYLLWMTDRAVGRRDAALVRTGLVIPALAVVVALLVTAGHPQQAYIALATGAGYGLFRLWIRWRTAGDWRPAGRGAARLTLGLLLGLALGAVQLLPSLFLSVESIRAGGLELYEAGSFSLRPGDLGTALLPGFTDAPRSEEYLAFVGFTGLWLAGLGVAMGRRRLVAALVLAIATTLLLAVGPELPFFRAAHRWVPGFDLFRVPARWLLVMNVALALLAGLGVEGLATGSGGPRSRRFLVGAGVAAAVMVAVGTTAVLAGEVPGRMVATWLAVGAASLALVLATAWRKGWWVWLLPLALVLELFFALRPLELARPVPAQAFATGGPVLGLLPDAPGGPRTLGLADPSYEVNDADRALYAREHYEAVGEDSFRQFLVAVKYRDTLSPNLANAYGRPSPDGYDGGVLPLRDYVRFKSALLPGSETQPDGLLRNQFSEIPDGWVLDLMGVGYVLADRKDDVEVGGVFVDREVAARVVGPAAIVLDLPVTLAVERVVMLGAVTGTEAARVRLQAGGTVGATFLLPAGELRISEAVAATPADEVRLEVAAGSTLDLAGVTLVDAAGRQHPLWLGPGAGLELLSWTDVKVYRVRDPAPRATLVGEFGLAAGPEAAVAMLSVGGGLDSRRQVVLEVPDGLERDAPPVLGGVADWLRGLRLLPAKGRFGVADEMLRADLEARSRVVAGRDGWRRLGDADGRVEIVAYAPEKIRLTASSTGPALLVLKDAIYPGWQVKIDGVAAPLLRADVLYRAVLLPGGEHEVTFTYEPGELLAGGLISITALVTVALLLAWPAIVGRRRTRIDA
jgi:hypothetical protein